MDVYGDYSDWNLLRVLSLELKSQVLVRRRGAIQDLSITEGDIEDYWLTMTSADIVGELLLSVKELHADTMVLLP